MIFACIEKCFVSNVDVPDSQKYNQRDHSAGGVAFFPHQQHQHECILIKHHKVALSERLCLTTSPKKGGKGATPKHRLQERTKKLTTLKARWHLQCVKSEILVKLFVRMRERDIETKNSALAFVCVA